MTGALDPWQQRVVDTALAALSDGRLGHALLLTGAPGMGKERVARVLAQRLLCGKPAADGLGCGDCRGCRLFSAGTHPDLLHVTFELNDKGDKFRSEIIVDQIRRLGAWFSLTPQLGGAQVALVVPADKLNDSAANALLKTLEEPSRDRYLLLVTDRPGRLPATIRSRCQRLEFRPPPREEAEAWMRARGHAAAVVAPALDAARGHPALADAWIVDGGLALRREVASELDAIARGRRSPVELAQHWLGDDHAALRLRFAAELALDAAAHRMTGARDPGLTAPADFQKLSAWFDRTLRVRDQLAVPGLRHDLALAGLLLEWRSLFNQTAMQGAGR